jgi:hypothetical protein
MRSICKKGSATLVAVLALCVVASASASAAEWHVGGKGMTGKAELSETAKVTENITFTVPKLGVKVVCTGAGLRGKEKDAILAPDTLEMEELDLTGCSEIEPTTCTVQKEIATEPLAGTLSTVSGSSSEDKLALKANAGKTVLTFRFNGTCAESGTQPIGPGGWTLLAPSGQNEAAEQTFTGQGSKESPLGGETMFGDPIYLSGALKLKLASASNWSFH